MSDKPVQVLLHSPHQNACILNRALLPARYCQEYLGKDVKLISARTFMEETPADVLVIHGMPLETAPSKYERWMKKGTKVIVSLDDDLLNLPDWNPIKGQFKPDQYGALEYSIRNTNGLLLSTQPLADTMPKGRNGEPQVPSWVCPNLIDMDLYQMDPKKPGRPLRILWCGSNTHHGDIEEVVESVTDILAMFHGKVEFLFWGDTHPELRRRHLYRGVNEIDAGPLMDYFSYLPKISPDIWLAPLNDHSFNHSKSNLKVLEGMACGAAVIASPTLPYSQTVNHGTNGFLARTRAEWTNALSALINDEKLRLSMQAAGVQTVHEKYNWRSEKCVQPWVQFFKAITKR